MEAFFISFIATFSILTFYLVVFENKDDDDDHGGGMMVPIYVPSNS